jgi:TPR repeat protein
VQSKLLIPLAVLGTAIGAVAVLFATGNIQLPFPSGQSTATGEATPESSSDPREPGENAAYEAFDQGKYLTALALAQEAAGVGDPQAHALVGRIYAEGLGVGKDEITAARWYARAAELGDVPSMVTFGNMLAEGRGVGKDRAKAAELYEKAAMTGDPLANYNLGLLFLRGDGKPENPSRAAQHIGYAAEKGIAAAQ